MKDLTRRLLTILSVVSICLLTSCSKDNQETIRLESEADLAGKKIAVATGNCYDISLTARDDVELHRFNKDADALQALLNGMTDLYVNDEVVINKYICQEYGIKTVLKTQEGFPAAFMFRKDEPELADAFTATLHRIAQDGTMERIRDYWMNDKYVSDQKFTHIPPVTEGTPLRFVTVVSTAPLSFMSDGDWYGFEIDILLEIAKDLHRPLQIELHDVTSAMMALKTGKADVLGGSVFITPEREEEFLFCEPYNVVHGAYYAIDRDADKGGHGLIQGLKRSIHKNLIAENRWKYITQGLLKTLKISVLAILLGSVLGVFLYVMNRSRRKWLRSVAGVYNWFIAGIPELVLLLILFYVVFAKTGFTPDTVAVITFALYFASGVSDVYASSLDAIPQGQTEAGLALGFTRVQTFFQIVLPQALKLGLPLYKGQCISLLKGTSIVGYIAIQDLTRAGDIIRSRTFDAFIPLLVVTVIYFLLVWLIGLLLNLASPKKKVL